MNMRLTYISTSIRKNVGNYSKLVTTVHRSVMSLLGVIIAMNVELQ